jgi:hypothetical protein
VKAEVALPDRQHAKLWSGMRHEEYADEAPLLKVVISPDKAVLVTQNALYSCFALFVADLYSVDAFCCIQEVVFLLLTHI